VELTKAEPGWLTQRWLSDPWGWLNYTPYLITCLQDMVGYLVQTSVCLTDTRDLLTFKCSHKGYLTSISWLGIMKNWTESSDFQLLQHTSYRISYELVIQRMPKVRGITDIPNMLDNDTWCAGLMNKVNPRRKSFVWNTKLWTSWELEGSTDFPCVCYFQVIMFLFDNLTPPCSLHQLCNTEWKMTGWLWIEKNGETIATSV
jgi:hypothetical protein